MDLLVYCLVLIVLGITKFKEPATTVKPEKGTFAPVSVQVADLSIGQNLQLAKITGAYTYILKEFGLR